MSPTCETKTRIIEMRSMTVNLTTDAPFDVKTFDQQIKWMNKRPEGAFAAFAQFCIMDDVMYLLPAEFSFQQVDLEKFSSVFPTAPIKKILAIGALEMEWHEGKVQRNIRSAENMPDKMRQESSAYMNGRFKELIEDSKDKDRYTFTIMV